MKKIFTLLFIALCGKLFSQSTTVYIPTVFHVIYNNSNQNVPDSLILKQLQTLNDDYSDTTCIGTYAPDVNTNIQFCLAVTDPSGNLTTGIIHKQTTVTSFSTNNAVKYSAQGGDDIWDRDKYLNIWVCNLGGGLLGYAQFPGGSANTDGVVIHYCTVYGTCAPFNLGKIAISETGTWLGLRSTTGSSCSIDNDSIADTPIHMFSGTVCNQVGNDPCCNIPYGLLMMNYMSFGEDSCVCFFTPGQKAKMWQTLNGVRLSLLSASGCMITGVENNLDANNISIFPNPSSGKFNLKMSQFENLKMKNADIYNAYGQKIYSAVNFQINQSSNFQIDLSSQPAGIYYLSIHSDKFSITKQLAVVK